MEVRNVLNQPVTTAFPIRETVQDWKPGAYFVVAWNAADGSIRENDSDYGEDDESRKTLAGMWVMDTDIALTTLTGRDGLTVFARSIASAQPLPEHEVVLLSRGNEPIGKAVTGADGRATFPAGLLRGRGAAEATSIMVTDANKQEFSRLELTKAAFDLSDRGIDGRASRPGRWLPLHRARRLSARRDGPAHGHAARRQRRRAEGHAGDADREAPRRQRVHALHRGAAGLGRAAPGDRPAQVLAPRPVVGRRVHRPQGGAGRPGRILGRGFRAGEAQGRAFDRRLGPAHRQDDQLRSLGRLPLWRARLRASRSRATCASRSTRTPSPPSPSTVSARKRRARISSRR